eukprot:2279255-Amphidinium_carterae.1
MWACTAESDGAVGARAKNFAGWPSPSNEILRVQHEWNRLQDTSSDNKALSVVPSEHCKSSDTMNPEELSESQVSRSLPSASTS